MIHLSTCIGRNSCIIVISCCTQKTPTPFEILQEGFLDIKKHPHQS